MSTNSDIVKYSPVYNSVQIGDGVNYIDDSLKFLGVMIVSGGQVMSGGANLTEVAAASANWNSTYTTVSTLSSTWGGSTDLSEIAAASANWNSTYTTVNTNSASWGGSVGGMSVGSLGLTIDNGVDVITTGVKGYIVAAYDASIQNWNLVSNISGNIVIDVWKSYMSIPLSGDSIVGTQYPMLTGNQIERSTTLNTWTTAISAGDVIGFSVSSVSLINKVTLTIGTLH